MTLKTNRKYYLQSKLDMIIKQKSVGRSFCHLISKLKRCGHPCFRGSMSHVSHLDHQGHVALGPRVVRLVLLAQQDDEVQVVPDVVLQRDVLLEGHRLVVELVSLQTCGNTHSR